MSTILVTKMRAICKRPENCSFTYLGQRRGWGGPVHSFRFRAVSGGGGVFRPTYLLSPWLNVSSCYPRVCFAVIAAAADSAHFFLYGLPFCRFHRRFVCFLRRQPHAASCMQKFKASIQICLDKISSYWDVCFYYFYAL